MDSTFFIIMLSIVCNLNLKTGALTVDRNKVLGIIRP